MTAADAEGLVTATDERVNRLRGVHLLDAEARVPERSWERWNGPARERVEAKKEAGRLGGLASARARAARASTAQPKSSTAAAVLKQNEHHTWPDLAGASNEAHGAREPGEADDEDAHLGAWLAVMATPPSPRVMPWLDDLARQFGAQQVASAIGAEAATDATRNTLLGRVQARLTTDSRHAEREAARARKAREAADEAAFRERVESMPPEQRQANLARLADAMKGVGHPGAMNGKEKEPRPSRATRTEHR